jgi:predicted Zn-dependent peptidase
LRQSFFFAVLAGHYHGQNGLAHFVEHMLAEEGENLLTKTPIKPFLTEGEGVNKLKEIYSVGGNLISGGAFVSLFHTGYGGALPYHSDNVKSFLETFGRYLLAPQFSYPVKKVSSVIAAERRENEGTKNSQAFRAHRLAATKQGHWCQDVIFNHGTDADLAAITPERCREFWRQYYCPQNIILCASGPMSSGEVVASLMDTLWAEKIAGERQSLQLAPFNISAPGHTSFITYSPIATSVAISAFALAPNKFTAAETNFARRLLSGYMRKTLREDMGLIYSLRCDINSLLDSLELSYDMDGINPNLLPKVYATYRELFDKLLKAGNDVYGLFVKLQKEAVESFCMPGPASEGLMKQLISMRIYEGKISTYRELMKIYAEVNIERLLELIAYLHPDRSYQRWVLPKGTPALDGLPCLDILQI